MSDGMNDAMNDSSSGGGSWPDWRELLGPGGEGKLQRLLRSGLHALRAEDASLAAAFAAAPAELASFYDTYDQGLGYWVSEATLAGALFRAWIPMEPTALRLAHPEAAATTEVDLAVMDRVRVSEGGVPLLFQLVWWPDNSPATLGLLQERMTPLVNWPGPGRRFLLTCWCSEPARWDEDWEEVSQFCRGGTLSGATLTPQWLGAFPTDRRAAGSRIDAHFAMCAIELT